MFISAGSLFLCLPVRAPRKRQHNLVRKKLAVPLLYVYSLSKPTEWKIVCKKIIAMYSLNDKKERITERQRVLVSQQEEEYDLPNIVTWFLHSTHALLHWNQRWRIDIKSRTYLVYLFIYFFYKNSILRRFVETYLEISLFWHLWIIDFVLMIYFTLWSLYCYVHKYVPFTYQLIASKYITFCKIIYYNVALLCFLDKFYTCW